MDIKSGQKYPAGALSNFAPHPFVFRGVKVASMEGVLQSFKYPQTEMQIVVCSMVGLAAKRYGSKKDWKKTQTLWWDGKAYPRKSEEYQELLDEVYNAMFDQNKKAKKALLATNSATLNHSIGRIKKAETVLTRQEFCSRLTKIRNRLKRKNIKEGLS